MLIRSVTSDLLLSFCTVAFQTSEDSKTEMPLVHPVWSEVTEWMLWQCSDVSCSLCAHRSGGMWVSVSLTVQKSSVPAANWLLYPLQYLVAKIRPQIWMRMNLIGSHRSSNVLC